MSTPLVLDGRQFDPTRATVYRIAHMSDEQVHLDGNGTTRRRRERHPPTRGRSARIDRSASMTGSLNAQYCQLGGDSCGTRSDINGTITP
jgi:hypothetical protein